MMASEGVIMRASRAKTRSRQLNIGGVGFM
jgi:hypothetical protein